MFSFECLANVLTMELQLQAGNTMPPIKDYWALSDTNISYCSSPSIIPIKL